MMIQPTRVLPSNASPLHDIDNAQEPRVLQEHSGNRQYHDYPYIEHDQHELKNRSSFLSENSYIGHQQLPHYATPPFYHQVHAQHHHHNNYRHGRLRPPTQREVNLRMQKVRRDAEEIYQRFRASDGYTKYRQKQTRDEKTNGEQKWPDVLELAFFQALAMWPPMGRRKENHKAKLQGRNELISDYIFEQTGVERDRKQVSSHIQVLKPFARGDPVIMRFFSGDSERARGRGGHVDRRHNSRYPIFEPPQAVYNGRMPMPRLETRDWSSYRSLPPAFEPLNFEMFVQQKERPDAVRRLHTYTASSVPSNPLDEHLQDWSTFSTAYPQLAKMNADKPLNCNIVAAEASIALTTDTWKDQKGIELGISFSCRSHRLPVNVKVSCRNRFYIDDAYVEVGSGKPDDVQLLRTDHGHVEAQVKFGSTFWAKKLAQFATHLRNCVDPMTGTSNAQEEVRRLIDGITATQELFVQTEDGKFEPLLVMSWKFRMANGPLGQTSWHRIVLPSPSPTQCDDPTKDELDSLMCGFPYEDPSPSHHLQPGLQSPFEYDQDSSSGSALTSATWSASFDDALHATLPGTDDFSGDNSFDFHGGNIAVSYNDTNFDFSNFDSTAFFDTTTSFAPDPILESFSQHDYSTQYCDGYANSFDTQQPMTASDTSFAMTAIDSQSQNVFEGFVEHFDPSFSVGNESQAFGGAGQEVTKEEDPLAALADASYIVEALTQEEPTSTTE